jgi:hypothetical protein
MVMSAAEERVKSMPWPMITADRSANRFRELPVFEPAAAT